MNLNEMDVVIPYRRTQQEQELRYVLRSLVNLPHRHVFISGDKSKITNSKVRHIPKKNPRAFKNRYVDAEYNVVNACMNQEVSNNFILMADDIFIMKPLKELKYLHMGTLSEQYKKRLKIAPNNPYVKGYNFTDNYLKAKGVENPLDFNLHVPMVMNKTKRLIVSELRRNNLGMRHILLSRSLYGNLFLDDYEYHEDVKYVGMDDNYKKFNILSTLDTSFDKGKIGKQIRDTFKKKSEYEL